MARQKKDGHYVTYYLNSDIYRRLIKYCDEVGQTNTTAIERILSQYLNQYEHKEDSNIKPKKVRK